ncbi:hypothetical protein KSS87_014567 [Heliosperma pusillum]|nr:hypothetical protein KSS87_014567 [Heliosperma pusillum]
MHKTNSPKAHNIQQQKSHKITPHYTITNTYHQPISKISHGDGITAKHYELCLIQN